ncbi:hypothetical protein MSL71_17990 [Desulfoluna butyratoxydans]|uniref:Uncharacterized protein n=1 Tax=Desulfoluna butyratoxydans TaxID=231438 RepID=A0A4U8YK19_9BACT|nr:hypothetical protein MSL71_17990 [Desulfoluna butyratoxydans]
MRTAPASRSHLFRKKNTAPSLTVPPLFHTPQSHGTVQTNFSMSFPKKRNGAEPPTSRHDPALFPLRSLKPQASSPTALPIYSPLTTCYSPSSTFYSQNRRPSPPTALPNPFTTHHLLLTFLHFLFPKPQALPTHSSSHPIHHSLLSTHLPPLSIPQTAGPPDPQLFPTYSPLTTHYSLFTFFPSPSVPAPPCKTQQSDPRPCIAAPKGPR